MINLIQLLQHKMLSRASKLIGLLMLFVAIPGQAQDTGLVNLTTTEAGMHRIYHAELVNQGVDLTGVRHSNFALSSDGQPVPISTEGQSSGRSRDFGAGGYIEFYAESADNLYTRSKVYTLHYDSSLRVEFQNERNRYRAQNGVSAQYRQTHLVESNNYYDFLSPSTTDPWHYGQVFSGAAGDIPGTAVDFALSELVGSTADMQVEVYGIVDISVEGNDHHFVAKINGTEVGDQQFEGNTATTLSVDDVPVTNGVNNFQLFIRSLASTPFDAIALNNISFQYQRNSEAVNDYLEGFFDTDQAVVTGISGGSASVYRREENGNITKLSAASGDGSSVYFNTGGVAGNYIVAGVGGHFTPGIAPMVDSGDINSGDAEYLIIAHSAFLGTELDGLVQLREVDYAVKVVDVAQIYAEYGNHMPGADAIHSYIKFAADNLNTRFVTLVGSDTYDYKNFKTASISYVPTKYVATPAGILTIQQTPSDAVYGDLDADHIPDLPVGRLSVRTQAELGDVVEKIRDFQAREGYAGNILIAGDKEDHGNGISFTADVADLIAAIPEDWRNTLSSEFIALPDVDGDQAAHDKLIAAINGGVSVTSYIGHSSQQHWSYATPPLLVANEIAGLTNIDKPTVVTQWGCWNTYFVDPSGNSMADKFLVGGLNGAATVLGASTLTGSVSERLMAIELNQRMYNQGVTIGEAVIQAKKALALISPNTSDILLGWQIIGDPALVVNP